MNSTKRRAVIVMIAFLVVASLVSLGKPGYAVTASETSTWIPPVDVSHSGMASQSPSVAVTPGGQVHVVWEENGAIYHSFEKDGAWSSPRQLFPGAQLVIVSSGDDVVGMLFVQPNGSIMDVFFTFWNGNSWASPRNISQTSGNSVSPYLAIGPDGHLYAVWSDTTPGYPAIYLADSGDGLVWSNGPVPNASGISPVIAVGKDSTLYVAWQQRYAGDTTPYEVFLSSYTASSGWSLPEDISNSPEVSSTLPDISTSPDGTVHIVWQEGNDILYTWGIPGAWATPANLSDGSTAYAPRVSVDLSGGIHVAWDEDTAILYRHSPGSGKAWDLKETVAADSSGAMNVSLTADAAGIPHAAWEDESGAGNVFYSTKGTTIPTATPTATTVVPTATDTSTPTLTPTATPTSTVLPPTATPSPTWTPVPTKTPRFRWKAYLPLVLVRAQ